MLRADGQVGSRILADPMMDWGMDDDFQHVRSEAFRLSLPMRPSHEHILSNLDGITSITCHVCTRVTDLGAEPFTDLRFADLRELATELDKQSRQRGEVIEQDKMNRPCPI